LIGAQGWTVLTGGYSGTMEAVSRGTAEAGGHVIGVTSAEIEAWRPLGPNHWVQEEKRLTTTRERLYALIEGCDAALALPGGIGTLAEVAMLWSLLQVGATATRPFVLIGTGWRTIFDHLYASFDPYIRTKDRSLLLFATDVGQAFDRVQAALQEGGARL
jgi:predicted Rossmann-fold nucleotide-binding protein